MMIQNCINFENLVNEKLKDPGFKEGLERADKKLKLELEFNELLRKKGYEDIFFIEVKDMDDY